VVLAGGKQGVRDFALLHSALERAKATYAGIDLYPTLFHKAAALLHSLVMNHAFLDGNKRTAYAIMVRFLNANGYRMTASQGEIVQMCVAVDNEGWEVPEIVEWVKQNTRR
jgi:death-on-curing protein